MRVHSIMTLLSKLRKCLIPTGPDNLFPFVDCFREVLADWSRRWQQFAFIASLLKCSRVTLAILIFAAVFLFLPNSQGQELTIRLSDNLTHSIVFLSGVLIWAFQAWIGTRKILDEIEDPSNYRRIRQAGDQPTPASPPQSQDQPVRGKWIACINCSLDCMKNQKLWLEHWPRILGLLVFVISTIALLMPVYYGRLSLWSMHGVLILANLALAAIFYKLLMMRRDWIGKKLGGVDSDAVEQSSHWMALDNMHAISGKISIVYIFALLMLATFIPVWLGFKLGSAGIAVLGFSSITAVGNFIIRSIVTQNHRQDYDSATEFPILTVLFLIAVVFSLFNDNHGVRVLSGEPVKRPELQEFVQQWHDRSGIAASQEPRPMILVATAGGGIRAAHWTVAVLTQLSDKNPRFRDSVFAISSVSGGSVGASIYGALLKDNTLCQSDSRNDCLQGTAKNLLSHDFLGPSVSALLFNDMLQRFLPFGILPDRQKALEKGWEKAFEKATGKTDGGLAAPYSSLWSKDAGKGRWLPLLLLNSMHMETGRKVIASPFLLDPSAFLDDVDLFQLLNGLDLPLSAAAGNSARFTYVSPPGTLPYKGSILKFWEDNGHLIDGGYFENNGAATLLELIRTMQRDDGGPSLFERYSIKPIVVLITNDSNLVCAKDDAETVECKDDIVINPQDKLSDKNPAITDFDGKFLRLTDDNGANETLGPIKGILNARSGHAVAAVKELRSWVERCRSSADHCHLPANAGPEFFHFRIEINEDEFPPALGWVLSKDSEELIWDMLDSSDHNKKEKDRLLNLLGG